MSTLAGIHKNRRRDKESSVKARGISLGRTRISDTFKIKDLDDLAPFLKRVDQLEAVSTACDKEYSPQKPLSEKQKSPSKELTFPAAVSPLAPTTNLPLEMKNLLNLSTCAQRLGL